MCGILCVFNCKKGTDTYKDKVLLRARRIRHRGPDWSGTHFTDKHILHHERLCIVDPEGGAQPLFNVKKTLALCVNGEIYNHRKLRAQYLDANSDGSKPKVPTDPKKSGAFLINDTTKKHVFQTHSDCEVILHLYAEFGVDGVTKFCNLLNGIWAFVLYDAEKDIYIAGRDHIGIIPLYRGIDAEGAVWISSELKAIHDVCVDFEEFPPGHFSIAKGNQHFWAKSDYRQWYNPKWYDETYVPQKPVDLKVLRDSLEASVVRQLQCDVPYGVLLSGGLDSSIIAALAAKHAAKRIEEDETEAAHWPRLHSFAIGLKGSPDLAAAALMAKHIGTVHHGFTFTVEEGLNAINDVIYHLETFDTTTVRAATPMYLLARKIRCLGVKMVLSGEGADEIFGGYLYFFKAPNKEAFHLENVQKLKGLHYFDCLRANKSMAAFGVEARVPFLDKEFMDEVAMAIDPADKVCGDKAKEKGRMEKWILRKAFEDLLPKEIAWRQKEQFSDGVGYNWIDTIKNYADETISDEDLVNAPKRFIDHAPTTKESYLYRRYFDAHFPQRAASQFCLPGGRSIACSTANAIAWDKAFQQLADCSGRAVSGVHVAALDDNDRKREMERVVETSDKLGNKGAKRQKV